MNKNQELIVITGGSSGIGKEVMKLLIERGYRVLITSRKEERLKSIEAEIKAEERKNLTTIACDVTKESEIRRMFNKIKEMRVELSVLITSAGVSKEENSNRVIPYPTSELPKSEWDSILNVNLKGVFLANKEALKIMVQQDYGQIINIGSAITKQGMKGQPYAPAYCASKFAVLGLGEAMAKEVANSGVTIQTICPGLVKTPLTENTALATLFDGKYIDAKNMAHSIVQMIESNKFIQTINPHYLPN